MDLMREELSSLMNNQTWTLVDFPPGRKAIRCGWIYKAKKNEHGAAYRLKRSLVAKWHSQKPGIDYNDTFVPVGDKVILGLGTSPAENRHCLSVWEPERNYIHDPTRGFWWWIRPSVCTSKVHQWLQTIGKRMVLSTFKFLEIHWIRNLSKRAMFVGSRWSSAFHLCW